MTNGEKMISAFPNGEVRMCEKGVVFSTGGWCHAYAKEWWEAKCKEPTTKNNLGVDLISRADVLQILMDYDYANENALVLKDIKALPSVTPHSRKGHWIADVDRWGDVVTTVNGYRCDKCNAFNLNKDNYCPNCGADMREVEA